jgi:hypothetical protein
VTESLQYRTVESSGRIELREYATYLSAEVDVEAQDHLAAANRGFRPLANYIFGGNVPNAKISMTTPVTAVAAGESIDMTTPVTAAPGDDGIYTIRFSMPSGWTMDTLPQPNNDRVRLAEHPARLVLANRFRGRSDAKRIAVGSRELRSYAADNSLVTDGEPMWAGYSAPYVPVPLRRWEMLIAVRREG